MDIHLAEEIRKQVEEAFRKRGRVNIVIAGRSGVGKSTLVNAVFHGRIADTGQGAPSRRRRASTRRTASPSASSTPAAWRWVPSRRR
nr:GTPase [Myxococcus xanthus]